MVPERFLLRHRQKIRFKMFVALISFGILLFACLGGWFFTRNKADSDEDHKQTRVIAFVLYFWLLVFAQVIIAALVYSLLIK